MKYSILMLLVLLLQLDSPIAMTCERNTIVQERIQQTVKTQEPNCKLKTKREGKRAYNTYYEWECPGGTVSALISTHSSKEKASEAFKALPDTFEENGFKMKVNQRNVGTGPGDENYFWVDEPNNVTTGVDFRSNCVIAHVGSNSAEWAYNLARQIARAIASVH